ncbi:hypothetical protein [Burkholderia ubonensis]|uniref:hypothetical protein n=1 Tax=Burkholderia ubonensis TaxID=101571 RepID=UPI00075CE23F|nr:hypothetical protein [Burkholderia ubonensis]KVS48185.1 hypothetical protein WK37_07480 [Burkholderia ubonensis]KVS49162.1 hypothetical protein WK38_17615 [Burkholderia ubonensis]KVS70480.1 hypothetical protein WK42_27815 [Burkholderia ubonensis]KVS88192.1 hypothetical protein WK43_18375 [Burkholderia ubonensis]KVS90291.1 hypothetical protein WK44_16085 [Burkholderia ubonensis]
MIIDLDETRIRTLEQVRAVLDGMQTLDFTPAANAQARCAWIVSVLVRFSYCELKRNDRGLVLRYLRRFSCDGRPDVMRMVR